MGNVKEKKYYYYVTLLSENETSGYLQMTQEQADFLNWATNPDNWEKLESNPLSGFFFVGNTKPIPVDYFHRNDYWDQLRKDGYFDELETEEKSTNEFTKGNSKAKKKEQGTV